MPDINANSNEQNIKQLESRDIHSGPDSPISYLENQIRHWQSLLESNRSKLELQRNELAKIILTKEQISLRIAKRKEIQARLDDCINNPAAHPELQPGDRERYIKLLPLDKQRLAVFTSQLTERIKEQQACETNIVQLENEIASIEFQLAANQNLRETFNNPNTFFSARKNRIKIDVITDYCSRFDSTRKPRQ